MSSELFETIEKQGLLIGDKVNLEKVKKLSPSEIIDFAFKTRELTSSKHMSREKSAYAFCSSLSLGGGTFPCSSLNCRLEKAKNLAQFSALYSDRVYINYYPSDYLNHLNENEAPDAETMRQRLVNDLSVLSYFRPLIETQKIIPITHPNYCMHCLAKKSFGDDADKKFDDIFSVLIKRFNKETIVTIEKWRNKFGLVVTAPESLVEHGTTCFIYKTPIPNIEKIPHILGQLDEGKKVTLSSSDVRKIGFDKILANEVRINLTFELASTQSINTNYLTDNTFAKK